MLKGEPTIPTVEPAASTPVLVLEYAQDRSPRPSLHILRIAAVAALAVCAVATAMIPIFDVETVMGSGPTLAAVATGMLIAAVHTRQRLGISIAAAHLSICLLFLMLVHLLDWGPADAYMPFLIMGTIWTILASAGTVMMFRQPSSTT